MYLPQYNIILLQCKIVLIFIITRTDKVRVRVSGLWLVTRAGIVCNFISNYVKYHANSRVELKYGYYTKEVPSFT